MVKAKMDRSTHSRCHIAVAQAPLVVERVARAVETARLPNVPVITPCENS